MKLAIIKLSAMGDIIHAMVALQYIKQFDASIKIDWFVEETFKGVLENNPHIDNIYTINLKSIKKNKKELFNQIKIISSYGKQNQYDLIIDAQGLIKSALVAKFLGKNRAGFDKTSTRESLASFFYQNKINIAYDENAIKRNAKVLTAPLGFEISHEDILNKQPFLYFQNESNLNEFIDSKKKNVLFIIGASWPSKMYDKDKFINVINELNENALIAWGSENEKEIASYIQSKSNAKMLPKISLNDLKMMVSKMDLVIGNDTGPTHMAWALNIPSITLFGNTPGYRNTYLTSVNVVLESNSNVDPFNLNKEDYSICEIKEELIVKTAKSLLI